ncbi:haloacid dehalogenase-like hydrolase [Prevotella cerevisiae]|uniref:Haloacid dehalogenase-like hydrolase n=1 Tax=Segatella cerevisiae TaxID=2053716 RepID=A0ABT1BX56_9BACT|nr:HAD family hydrolase [Segatella cerevisiae]MCO6025662.1 haloacid dehalogenase-like hydrolase [Segatella cerevisiae]
MYRLFILLIFLSCHATLTFSQTFRKISGWSDEINNRIEGFLNATITMKTRKVAVFDGDGTVIGQVPYYLADEALYQYADKHYKGSKDPNSIKKLSILQRMVKDGNNVGKAYVENRVHFLSGMTPNEIMDMGYTCYLNSYQGKFYPEMKQLIANLKEYGFEIWILTASPEFLYQKFLTEELGVPDTHILGVKAVVANGVLTDEIIMPIPQDDGKANVIPTFIKARPLIVAGNSRGDLDMLNQSCGLKIIVNPDDSTVRGKNDGPMNGYTVKQYWEKEGAIIVKCNDITEPHIKFHTRSWHIRTNKSNPK